MKMHLQITLPQNDPLSGSQPTPSMKATLKYFWVVCALIVVQVIMGVITAHYGVEGNSFYGLSLAEYTSLFRIKNVACAACNFLDSDIMACNRIIHCTGGIRIRAKVSEIRSKLSIYCSTDYCCRFNDRTMDGSNAETWVCCRTSGLGIRVMNMLILAGSGSCFYL